jgi:hypothetical protein
VHLKGVIDDGVMSQNAFILPAGYRPAKGLVLTTAASHEFGELLIHTDGRVEPLIGLNGFFSLDGIVFPAA